MSAFIVSHETMNRVVASILPLRLHQVTVFSSFEPNDIARDLYRLNNKAVEARYGKMDSDPMANYTFALSKVYNKFELLKACQCLRYQCAEGDVVKNPLFLFLNNHVNYLMNEIVRFMPEYEKAAWDAA